MRAPLDRVRPVVVTRNGTRCCFGPTAPYETGTNDPGSNKLWSAAIDFTQRRATVAQVYQGVTSTGAEVETLDFR